MPFLVPSPHKLTDEERRMELVSRRETMFTHKGHSVLQQMVLLPRVTDEHVNSLIGWKVEGKVSDPASSDKKEREEGFWRGARDYVKNSAWIREETANMPILAPDNTFVSGQSISSSSLFT